METEKIPEMLWKLLESTGSIPSGFIPEFRVISWDFPFFHLFLDFSLLFLPVQGSSLGFPTFPWVFPWIFARSLAQDLDLDPTPLEWGEFPCSRPVFPADLSSLTIPCDEDEEEEEEELSKDRDSSDSMNNSQNSTLNLEEQEMEGDDIYEVLPGEPRIPNFSLEK